MRRRDLTKLAMAAPMLGLVRREARAADTEFKIGVVASVTGSFAAPTKDTFDGLNAWIKMAGLPGRKIVLETLDDETNPVNAANAFRRLAGDPSVSLIYLFINSTSAMAAKSFASEFKVPIITGGGADSLGKPADPWMFKVVPSNRDYMIGDVRVHPQEGLQEARPPVFRRYLRPVRPHQPAGPGAEIRLQHRRGREVRHRGYQLQRAMDPHPRRAAGHHLQQRHRPRGAAVVPAVQAARHPDAADRHRLGDQRGVLPGASAARTRRTG